MMDQGVVAVLMQPVAAQGGLEGVSVETVISAAAAAAGWSQALGGFDLETTRVDTATARIVTAHVGVIDETGAVVERKDWIVDPGIAIPDGAARVHGITTESARRFGGSPLLVVPGIPAALPSA